MVKFRKKTRRKLKRKSKQSIKGGRNTFHCYTEEQLDKIKKDAIADNMEVNRKQRQQQRKQDGSPVRSPPRRRRRRKDAQLPRTQYNKGKKRNVEEQELFQELEQDAPYLQTQSSFDGDDERGMGGSKKIKRRKKKKTRKARGIIDDLRELCTTGRCGSPRPQTPTLRQLALTIEQNILRDLNKNEPEIALTSEQRRNIKAVANHEAARIVNNSRSASKKKKKKRR